MALQVVKTGDDGVVLGGAITLPSGSVVPAPTITGGTITSTVLVAVPVNPYIVSITADGAISLDSGVTLLAKTGSAGAFTVAAPGVAGKRITLTTTTDFAHVTTFTGATLWDGTATANSTWTSAAVQGSSLTIVSVSATKWNVESFNLGTIAP